MTQIRPVNAASVGVPDRQHATGRTVLRGSYPWPLVPSVGENPNDQPDVDTPLASRILDPAPCGYFIPQAEYTAPRIGSARRRTTFGTVAQRLAFHGIQVEPRTGGVFVPLRSRYGGLIAPILDSEAVLPMIETAQRRYSASRVDRSAAPCRRRCRSRSAPRRRFGAFTPGVAGLHGATTANVISTAGDATLSAADPSAQTRATWSTAASPCRSR